MMASCINSYIMIAIKIGPVKDIDLSRQPLSVIIKEVFMEGIRLIKNMLSDGKLDYPQIHGLKRFRPPR
jgi:hypothetical protein